MRMDYVTRQFINLTKRLLRETRKAFTSLGIDLHHIKDGGWPGLNHQPSAPSKIRLGGDFRDWHDAAEIHASPAQRPRARFFLGHPSFIHHSGRLRSDLN